MVVPLEKLIPPKHPPPTLIFVPDGSKLNAAGLLLYVTLETVSPVGQYVEPSVSVDVSVYSPPVYAVVYVVFI